MPPEDSDGQRSERRTIDDSALVRERVLKIIDHNTGGSQPPAVHVSGSVSIAARADIDPDTVQSVLAALAAEGVIERSTTNGDERIALV